MTPPGRLRAMTNRVSATLEAVRIVRPALERFYNSLSDEQQARFNALGPNIGERSPQHQQQEANAQSESCGEPKSSLTSCRSSGSRPCYTRRASKRTRSTA